MAELNNFPEADLLFQILNFIAPLPLALRELMGGFLTRERYPKKHLLLREGEVARRIYFIPQGFARAFFYDRDGREHTTWFMGPGDIMISVYSFYRQQPAAENIELLEDCTLLALTWEQVQAIYAEFPMFNFHGRLLTEKYYIQSEERAVLLRTKQPKERYRLLLETYPQVLQRATLGQVASFLGITQETLSRIRARR
jgi:CRP-like cAMP-binding protein